MGKKLLIFGMILFIILIVGAFNLTKFTNSLTTENLTFTGSQNFTRNISLYKNSNVTSAFLNLSGYIDKDRYTGDHFDTAGIGNAEPFGMTTNDTYLWIVDNIGDEVYKHWMNGTYTEDHFDTAESGNAEPFGITNNNTYLWIVDRTDYDVYKYWMNGSYTGVSFDTNDSTSGNIAPFGITTNNTYFWITNSDTDEVYKYWMNGTYTGDHFDTAGDGLTTPRDITTNNTYLWIADTLGAEVYKYWLNGTYTDESFDVADNIPTGLFGIMTNNTYIWVSHSQIQEIYKYWIDISYTRNVYLEVGTYDDSAEWANVVEFNSTFSPNKTDNFFSSINTAINDADCDCTGCFLENDNCTIPFLFHSDTAGKIEYSTLNITYDKRPIVTLESPANNTASSATKTFNCSATDPVKLANITFYFWNSSGYLNVSQEKSFVGSDTSASSTYGMTFSVTDTYYWNCRVMNNESDYDWANINFTINVNLEDPAVTLSLPTDEYFSNSVIVDFNYTPTHDAQTVQYCHLYENWTSAWNLNQTDNSITEDIVNSFTETLTEGTYKWNILCNTSEAGNEAFAISNRTLTIDISDPLIILNSITATQGSQTFNFNATAADTNLDSCKYSIFDLDGNIDGLNENISFTCNITKGATTTEFKTYNLSVYSTDLAGNENMSYSLFTMTPGFPPAGGSVIIVEPINVTWIMTTEGGTQRYQFNLVQGTTRTKDLLFESVDDEIREITLSCEGELCPYIEFETTTFDLSIERDIKTAVSFTLDIPDDVLKGDYFANIIAQDDLGKINIVTIEGNVETFNIIVSILTKIISSKNIAGISIPYFLIFLFTVFIVSFGTYFLILKPIKAAGGWSVVIGSLFGFLLLIFI